MKKLATILVVFWGVIGFSCQSCKASEADDWEISFLQREFAHLIGNAANFDQNYIQLTKMHVMRQIYNNPEITDFQYLVYADRNPSEQNIYICYYDADRKDIIFIGGAKTSTGNSKRKGDYFETPTGFFKNDPRILGYRAQGTKNKKGWMGLGTKNSRVWDFGWQGTVKCGHPCQIRMLMHATDPHFGEARLGSIDSKGCVRLSNKLARFIDYYGIIDRDYESSPDRSRQALLLPGRKPVKNAGNFLLVGDSRDFMIARN